MSQLFLNQCGIVCALGNDVATVRQRLLDDAASGLSWTSEFSPPVIAQISAPAESTTMPADPTGKATLIGANALANASVSACPATITVATTTATVPALQLPLGRVQADLPSMAHWPLAMQSRNNQLALAALAQIRPALDVAIAQYGSERVAVVIGTSTSGIDRTEHAMGEQVQHQALPPEFHYAQQEMGSVAEMLATELGVSGPAYVHSSACSSSAKAIASAARLLRMGLVDAVLTGGVDTLCRFTVAGFSALESVSKTPCQPMSANRNGINIGEAAALFLLTREPGPVALLGWGESSDGHHMSAPDPAGHGARLAMQQALDKAGLTPQQIDYINLHGTATIQNDAMESRVVAELFGLDVPCSSTKPFTGHTLGAAAAVEAAFCWIALQDDAGRWPPHLWDGARDAALPHLNLVAAVHGNNTRIPAAATTPVNATNSTTPAISTHAASATGKRRIALSNSFAFGGSNACLIFGSAP